MPLFGFLAVTVDVGFGIGFSSRQQVLHHAQHQQEAATQGAEMEFKVSYSLRLNHRKVYHRKFDLLSESGSLMWQKSLSNVLDLDSFIAILSNMNLVSDFVR